MRLRTFIAATVLLAAQLHWAHAAPMPASPPAPAEAAGAMPCHGAGDHAPAVSHDEPAGHEGHDSHDCCGAASCSAAGCHCACSAAPALALAEPQALMALWVIRHDAARLTAPPVARPSDPFRPPI